MAPSSLPLHCYDVVRMSFKRAAGQEAREPVEKFWDVMRCDGMLCNKAASLLMGYLHSQCGTC